MDRVDLSEINEQYEERRLARILTTLIWASWGVYLFVIVTGLIYADWTLVFVTLAGSALLSGPFVLLRQRHLRASSLFLMLIELGTITFIATVGQGIRDLAIVAFPILIIFAGLTLNRTMFRLCVGLTLVAVCWLVFGEAYGWFITKPFIGELTNWLYLIGTTLILLLAATAVDLLATNMRKSLELAHREIAQRKQAEEAMCQSEERLQSLLDNLEDGCYEVDTAGNLTYFNPAYARIMGRPANELMGMNNRSYMTPEGFKAVYQIFNRVFRTGIPEQAFDWELLRPDGTRRSVEVSVSLIKATNGSITGFRGIVRDITERKQLEHQKEERMKELNAFFNLARLIEREGISPDELFQEYVEILPESWQYPEIACARVVIDNREFSTKNFKESGWKLSAPIKVNGTIMGRIEIGYLEERPEEAEGPFLLEEKILLDAIAERLGRFSERKRMEEKLENELIILKTLIDALPDRVYVMDVQGRKTVANIADWQASGGKTMEDVIGKTDLETYPPELAQDYWALDKSVIDSGKPIFNREEAGLDPKGDPVWLLSSKVPLCDAQGKVIGLVGVGRDITGRKQAEKKLKEYSDHLEEMVEERTRELGEAQEQLVRKERLAVLGQMAGSITHELRNPLGVISNAIYVLKLVQPEANDKVRKYHAMIEQEVHTADKIIADLLDFARIKPAKREQISVASLVSHTLERFHVPATVEVTLDLPADLPLVFADPGQVEQVLGNLVMNAWQAMSKGGKLSVTSEQVSGSREQGAVKGERWVRIHVKDNGDGILPENMQKIFEPLFSTKTTGIGLGLVICKSLAEANDGRIEVESEAGVGSTFTMWLPVVKEESQKSKVES